MVGTPAGRTRSQTKRKTSISVDAIPDEQVLVQQLDPPEENIQAPKLTEDETDIIQPNEEERIENEEPNKILIFEMNQKTIQENITCLIKEFSNDGTTHVENELTKFLDTADMLYDSLNTEEEKHTFTKLIKFRLNGDAYSRISHRNIANYDEFKQTLRTMFLPAYSLNELERRCTEMKQKYGETINNFGFRLTEALEEYKQGYRTKYNLKNMDEAYSKHLESNTIQTFKRGLNNTILKERIATVRAESLRQIIDEAVDIDRMLNITVDTSYNRTTPVQEKPRPLQIICNFCQKPNHTWDVCRTRIQSQRKQNYGREQRPFNQPSYYQPDNRAREVPKPNFNQHFQQDNFRQFQNPAREQNSRFPYPRNIPTNNNMPTRRQYKFCSHCKINGHSFDECRSKFLNRKYTATDQPSQPQQTRGLEEEFKKLNINAITAQNYEEFPQQGNSTGSNQA